jgi:hypothetical protein
MYIGDGRDTPKYLSVNKQLVFGSSPKCSSQSAHGATNKAQSWVAMRSASLSAGRLKTRRLLLAGSKRFLMGITKDRE